jgi:PAS domain S-box-containing protein
MVEDAPKAPSGLRIAQATSSALKLVLIYAGFSGLWILLSDSAVVSLFSDPTSIAVASTLKGWLFVAITSLLLYRLTARLINQALAVSSRELEAQKERVQAEVAFRESERRFRQFVENANDVLFEITPSGVLTYVSPQWKSAFGYETSETIGQPFPPFVHPDDLPICVESLQQSLSTGEKQSGVEFRVLRKDGTYVWYTANTSLMQDPADGTQTLFGIGRDITERKRAEEARRASDEQLRAFYELDLVGLAITSPEKGWIRVNRCLCQMLEYSEQELRGMTWVQVTHPEDLAADVDQFNRVLTSEIEGYSLEKRFISRTGKTVPTRLVVRCIRRGDGAVDFVTAMVEDITERKQAEADRARFEAQLRESQKMEALGTMAGGVAHDFNNALAAILGNLELARQDVGTDHPALVSLEEIGKASRRAKDIVQQILAFGRRQKVERKPMSLALVVVEAARLIRATLPAMISMNVNCDGDTPAVLADATQMGQVLLNLCSNAAHAVEDMGRPGVIEVNLSAYDGTRGGGHPNLPPGRYACLTIRDNGLGMDEETRSRIFDPFFTTKPAGKGTGLGLSVVHGIVQEHEGSIEAESTSGEGSTFRIYFPAVDAQLASVAVLAPEATPVQGRGKHVLYLDDEEAIIFLMKRLLERKGYRVSGYTEPQQALAAVRANPYEFDLAVTDYYMPGMSGLEVAQALRDIRPDLPVVMASGYINEDLRAKAPAVGIRELIYKPNTVEDLCDAIARFANAQNPEESPP